MDRETYLQYRQENNLTPVAYDYYVNNYNGRNKVDIRMFVKTFPIFEMRERVVAASNRKDGINWGLLWKHYDMKFDVRILHYIETGEIIQIF